MTSGDNSKIVQARNKVRNYCEGSPESQPGYDFYSRYFAPWNGIPEDPVTGQSKKPVHKLHNLMEHFFGSFYNLHKHFRQHCISFSFSVFSFQVLLILYSAVTGLKNWERRNCWVNTFAWVLSIYLSIYIDI